MVLLILIDVNLEDVLIPKLAMKDLANVIAELNQSTLSVDLMV